ncbi:hypothetical protein SSAG_05816 [Streptomyces sp. Mg1]|nr:hypothetical protein SSAG_05816 [Streptomyces sp. Mg1]
MRAHTSLRGTPGTRNGSRAPGFSQTRRRRRGKRGPRAGPRGRRAVNSMNERMTGAAPVGDRLGTRLRRALARDAGMMTLRATGCPASGRHRHGHSIASCKGNCARARARDKAVIEFLTAFYCCGPRNL